MTRDEALALPHAETLVNGRCVGHTEYDPARGTVLVIDWHDPAGCEHFTHAFRTFLGIPPSKNEQPVCGARIDDSYDWATGRPPCPACAAIIDKEAGR